MVLFIDKMGKRLTKEQFIEKARKKHGNKYFDKNLSEPVNLKNNGIYKIYDCGKIIYNLILTK